MLPYQLGVLECHDLPHGLFRGTIEAFRRMYTLAVADLLPGVRELLQQAAQHLAAFIPPAARIALQAILAQPTGDLVSFCRLTSQDGIGAFGKASLQSRLTCTNSVHAAYMTSGCHLPAGNQVIHC